MKRPVPAGVGLMKASDAPKILRRIRRPRGWRATVAVGSLAAATVLIINITLLAWSRSKPEVDDQGNVILFSGNCKTSARISTWSHLGINILSTMLLAVSNSAMQGLSAPTRTEVDNAHAKGRWVGIGVTSLSNLRIIGSIRVLAWVFLAISSIPLHLLYNSTIYQVLSANNYYMLTATKSFAHNGPWNQTQAIECKMQFGAGPEWLDLVNTIQQQASSWTQLSNADCIKAYGQQLVSEWANVVLVLNVESTNNSDSFYGLRTYDSWDVHHPEYWICDKACCSATTCNIQTQTSNAPIWTQPAVVIPDTSKPDCSFRAVSSTLWTDNLPVEYCLAQPVEPACKIGFNTTLMTVVVACNIVKLICLLCAILIPGHKPLLTIGDAIESFMDELDSTTIGQCTLSILDVRRGKFNRSVKDSVYSAVNPTERPKPWHEIRPRWGSAASPRLWVITAILFCLTWAAVFGLFIASGLFLAPYGSSFPSAAQLASYGIGNVNTRTIITTYITTLAGNVLVANSPQLAFSFIYILYNRLFTSMLLGLEWSSYARQRKSLRVSAPSGEQRSTYFLQLPYRYSFPLMVASILLHWLVSQSMFLVIIHITGYDTQLKPLANAQLIGCGWSPLGQILVLALFGSMLFVLGGSALFRRYDGSMPLVSNCSLAISAACHPVYKGMNEAQDKLMWGVVTGEGEEIGHACFSIGRVKPLKEGGLYA